MLAVPRHIVACCAVARSTAHVVASLHLHAVPSLVPQPMLLQAYICMLYRRSFHSPCVPLVLQACVCVLCRLSFMCGPIAVLDLPWTLLLYH